MAIHWDDQDEEQKPPGEKGEYCELCHKSGPWLTLLKCPMCHKYFCEACAYHFGGKDFCSAHCGNEFFFGGDEDEDG